MANSYDFYISKGFDHEAALYFANGKRSIKSVFANDDYTLTITFDNDEKRILDMNADLQKGIFKAFQNLKDFKRVYLDEDRAISWDIDPNIDSSVIWNNKIDLCPDNSYIQSVPIEE